jgi:hypothetical protein
MAKLLVERPRVGGRGKLRRYRHFDPTEDGPLRQSMSRNLPGRGKALNENLSPLIRYLRSKVGQLWDEVHAELREHVRADSAIQLHILQHLWQIVVRDAVILDGVPCQGAGRYGQPLTSYRFGQRFYVHPESRLLLAVPQRPSRKRREKPKPPLELSDGRQAHRIDGIWYAVELAPYVPSALPVNDVIFGWIEGLTGWRQRQETYGRGDRYGVRKQQLGKREIRRLGLR